MSDQIKNKAVLIIGHPHLGLSPGLMSKVQEIIQDYPDVIVVGHPMGDKPEGGSVADVCLKQMADVCLKQIREILEPKPLNLDLLEKPRELKGVLSLAKSKYHK